MKHSIVSASRQNFGSLLAPIGILVTAGALLGVELKSSSGLLGASVVQSDTDGDGLVNPQERVLGTLSSVADSDQDGFSDSEELARGTSPVYSEFFPEGGGLSVGLTAHGERDGLHAVIAVYLPNHEYQDIDLHVGVLIGSRIRILPTSLVEARGNIEFVPAADPNAAVAIVDFRFDRSWVDMTGHLTMFATVGRNGSGRVTSASAIDLFNVGGVVVLAMLQPIALHGNMSAGDGYTSTVAQTVYKPLTSGGGDVPAGWTVGEVCWQNSEPVAVSGALVTHEIISASCSSGWDGSCPSSCSSSVGSTYTTVDPAALIGG